MFGSLKKLFHQDNSDTAQYDIQAEQLDAELTALEKTLTENPNNGETQKALMLRYNQALQVYAKSKTHRQHIDALFVKIDELRNTIRRTI
ncbi:hypothetical protein MUA02_15420 [Enterobacteriaceae bacterium H20N1]|uniref:Uncharacterized protein n=1 Tax=Dryocola boscaweniae TaxID=2925397 RepID=A0A9X2WAR1_9ENTR|nr:hypothetical protein [Dryocola boscaweniae]MCT4703243.1 hypothetical protein [Dryocola boscaweniae]MCT4715635.1 hypothetical protein [Dryocola boscaweniae]MCT4720411.1 hypothetical protein [Dryocola boscaweniae]